MSDGRQHAISDRTKLSAWVDSRPLAAALSELMGLRAMDYQLIGQITQLMCFIDFNGRRALRALQGAPGSTKATKVQHMQDSQVLSHLQEAIESTDLPDDERLAAEFACGVAREMANLRHHLAHWACYRFPQADALIMMTYNAKEGAKRSGLPIDEDELVYAIVSVPGLRGKIPPLTEASDLLSELTGTWVSRYIGEDGARPGGS